MGVPFVSESEWRQWAQLLVAGSCHITRRGLNPKTSRVLKKAVIDVMMSDEAVLTAVVTAVTADVVFIVVVAVEVLAM